MAGLAFLASIRLEQGVVEAAGNAETFNARMIAMAGEAILLQEFLVEGRARQRLLDGLPEGRQLADLFGLVTGRATFGGTADEGGMAGKAVRF